MTELSDLELLDALGVEAKPDKKISLTHREERIIAGFEEVQKFVEDHGRIPAHGEDKDIFERLYATRLDQIRKLAECRDLVEEMDHQGLLDGALDADVKTGDDLDDDELLSQLGVDASLESDVTVLKHVKSRAEVRAAEEIASRTKCEDFEKFKPVFEVAQEELKTGVCETRKFRKDAGFLKSDFKKGQLIILGGQTAYIAEFGEIIKAPNGEDDARLRVIYSNGTESDILLRSLVRAMYKDKTSRIITDPSMGPLFSGAEGEDDLPSGTIYVLRSLSDHPIVSENREIIHKIGVTGGSVEKRVAGAKLDPTFLMADVEVVATYKLSNINRTKLEKILHKVFESAKLDIQIKDRFGNPVSPHEWFLVPLFVIDEVVDKIREGTIGGYVFDIERARLIWRNAEAGCAGADGAK